MSPNKAKGQDNLLDILYNKTSMYATTQNAKTIPTQRRRSQARVEYVQHQLLQVEFCNLAISQSHSNFVTLCDVGTFGVEERQSLREDHLSNQGLAAYRLRATHYRKLQIAHVLLNCIIPCTRSINSSRTFSYAPSQSVLLPADFLHFAFQHGATDACGMKRKPAVIRIRTQAWCGAVADTISCGVYMSARRRSRPLGAGGKISPYIFTAGSFQF